ncbi:4'-phosphopantetheinyl transferase family protein [Dokdonia pacifica]|uniref:4'-phosphopantetheinyl transferase n=1 Tax=Dokdonia pacifica TaxID=1627892 RepID=A0A239E2H6_9FLAO|nr:4'-phosphopantetheinyl transferase superfamily protein [Dokdonia pacifica]SNS38886.1 4'-phosphopantetheinyl transferase [Dokdonia pacifica]
MITKNSTYSVAFSDFKSIPQIDLKEDEYYLFQYSTENGIDQNSLKYYLDFLPQGFKEEVLKYRRWDDRYNCLFGKLMIYLGATMFGNDSFEFNKILKDSYGKPFMEDSNFNFNISHSGNTVVCVFSKQEVGVDIEEINDIDYDLFENVFTPKELQDIKDNGLDTFYEYWTKKESVIKAIGKGMSIPLTEIKIDKESTTYNDNTWYTKSFKMDNKYCSITSKSKFKNAQDMHVVF